MNRTDLHNTVLEFVGTHEHWDAGATHILPNVTLDKARQMNFQINGDTAVEETHKYKFDDGKFIITMMWNEEADYDHINEQANKFMLDALGIVSVLTGTVFAHMERA